VPVRVEVPVPVRVPVYIPAPQPAAAEPCDCEAPSHHLPPRPSHGPQYDKQANLASIELEKK